MWESSGAAVVLVQSSSPGKLAFVRYLRRIVFMLFSNVFRYRSLSRCLAFNKEACTTSPPQNGRCVSRGEGEFERPLDLGILINCFINELQKDYYGLLFLSVEANAGRSILGKLFCVPSKLGESWYYIFYFDRENICLRIRRADTLSGRGIDLTFQQVSDNCISLVQQVLLSLKS